MASKGTRTLADGGAPTDNNLLHWSEDNSQTEKLIGMSSLKGPPDGADLIDFRRDNFKQPLTPPQAELGDELDNSGGFLPLKTPERRVLRQASQEVRKRSLEVAADAESAALVCTDASTDVKRRHVSKALLFDPPSPVEFGKKGNGPPVRCIFGPPIEEELDNVRRQFDEHVRLEFDAFSKRFGFTEEDREELLK